MFLYLPHEIFSKTHTLRQMLLKLDCTGSQDEKQLKAKGGKRDPITSPLHQDKKICPKERGRGAGDEMGHGSFTLAYENQMFK